MQFCLSEDSSPWVKLFRSCRDTVFPASIRDHANAQTIPLLAKSLGHSLREFGLESMVLEQDYGGLELGMLDAVVVRSNWGGRLSDCFHSSKCCGPFSVKSSW